MLNHPLETNRFISGFHKSANVILPAILVSIPIAETTLSTAGRLADELGKAHYATLFKSMNVPPDRDVVDALVINRAVNLNLDELQNMQAYMISDYLYKKYLEEAKRKR